MRAVFRLLRRMSGSLSRRWHSLLLRLTVRGSGRRLQAGPRVTIFGAENITMGDNLSIVGDVMFSATNGKLSIGDRVAINRNTCIDASQGGVIEIGSDVLIGPNAVLRASDHAHKRTDIAIRIQGHTGGVIIVEEGAWIAANVVVTRDVRIGAHAIVAAGAVVIHDVPPYAVVAGVPAKFLRDRRSEQST